MAYKPKPPRYDSFPLVSVLHEEDMREAILTMELDLACQAAIVDMFEERARCKAKLREIMNRNSTPGLRYGNIAAYNNGKRRKKTLSKRLLVENGVVMSAIDASYELSKEYEDTKIVDLSKSATHKGKEAREKWEGNMDEWETEETGEED